MQAVRFHGPDGPCDGCFYAQKLPGMFPVPDAVDMSDGPFGTELSDGVVNGMYAGDEWNLRRFRTRLEEAERLLRGHLDMNAKDCSCEPCKQTRKYFSDWRTK